MAFQLWKSPDLYRTNLKLALWMTLKVLTKIFKKWCILYIPQLKNNKVNLNTLLSKNTCEDKKGFYHSIKSIFKILFTSFLSQNFLTFEISIDTSMCILVKYNTSL